MKYIINNIKISIDDDFEQVKKEVSKKLAISPKDIVNMRISKESIDARKKNNISFIYSVIVTVESNKSIRESTDVKKIEDNNESNIQKGNLKLNSRAIVVGTGPAGLFAGLLLAKNGFKPLIIERGESVEKRVEKIDKYWKFGILDTETNVQFGEGGAGTFSDGKLTTRISDSRCEEVLNTFYSCGAHEEILYKAKPHIGTDILRNVIVNIRKKIIELGGEVRFNSKLTGLEILNNKINKITINGNENINCEVLVLAIGHSSRDTFEILLKSGVEIVQKPFSVGVRIEHHQEPINKAQYGNFSNHKKLGAADYQLFHKIGDRTAYSFCMCPGGSVVASASEENSIVTNGMSEFLRDKANANSAFVVNVESKDFENSHPLAGVEFQRKIERDAFIIGGAKNFAPVQKLGDFIDGKCTTNLGEIKPSYTGGFEFADINKCLPRVVSDTMKSALNIFDRKLNGFSIKDAILTAPETRTSSPIRITRNENFESVNVKGLYPTGEGAGYAGGIMSAGVDGLKVAESIISKYFYE